MTARTADGIKERLALIRTLIGVGLLIDASLFGAAYSAYGNAQRFSVYIAAIVAIVVVSAAVAFALAMAVRLINELEEDNG